MTATRRAARATWESYDQAAVSASRPADAAWAGVPLTVGGRRAVSHEARDALARLESTNYESAGGRASEQGFGDLMRVATAESGVCTSPIARRYTAAPKRSQPWECAKCGGTNSGVVALCAVCGAVKKGGGVGDVLHIVSAPAAVLAVRALLAMKMKVDAAAGSGGGSGGNGVALPLLLRDAMVREVGPDVAASRQASLLTCIETCVARARARAGARPPPPPHATYA